MATQIYRYRSVFLDPNEVKRGIDPAVAASLAITAMAPEISVDVTVDDTAKDDLDAIMAELGWQFVVANPTRTPPIGIVVKQVMETRQVVDTSTVSTAFVDLLTIAITTEVGFLEIYAGVSTNTLIVGGFARLMLDGAAILDGGSGHLLGLAPHVINKRVAVTAGAHTVKVQWRTAVGGTIQCRPVTNPDQESATLIVRETT